MAIRAEGGLEPLYIMLGSPVTKESTIHSVVVACISLFELRPWIEVQVKMIILYARTGSYL